MRIHFVLLGVALGQCAYIMGMSEYGRPFATNRLAILLDTEEGRVGNPSMGVTRQLLDLIETKTCPILMTKDLWKRFVWGRKLIDDVQKLDKQDFDKKYSALDYALKENYPKYIEILQLGSLRERSKEESKKRAARFTELYGSLPDFLVVWHIVAMVILRIHFNPDEWVYGNTGENFVLLIPKEYQEKMGKTLGLELGRDRYESVLKEEFSLSDAGDSTNLGAKLLAEFDSIFTPSTSDDKHWAIYLSGHGSFGKIAALEIPEFKKLLNYFTKKVPVSVFAYTSCYAAGSNLYETYIKDIKTGYVEQHPFVIALAGISESKVTAGSQDFGAFFAECEKRNKTINWAEALEDLFQFSLQPKENTPLIKFPGTEWFNVPDIKEFALSIGKVLAATREKPILLEQQKLILLYAPDIPFSLMYRQSPRSADDCPIVVSMIPGDACHVFSSILAQSYNASSLFKSFLSYPDIPDEKVFFIKKLVVANDLEEGRPVVTLSNVLCMHRGQDADLTKSFFGFKNPSSDSAIICFTYKGKAYGWQRKSLKEGFKLEEINPNYAGRASAYLQKYIPSGESFTPAIKGRLKDVFSPEQRKGREYEVPAPQAHAKTSKKNLRVAKRMKSKNKLDSHNNRARGIMA